MTLPKTLRVLCELLAEEGEPFAAPHEPLPDIPEVVILGVATRDMQRIYAVYATLSESAMGSPECPEEEAITNQIAHCKESGKPVSEELWQKLQALQARLSGIETLIDVAWTLFVAEAARVFPSHLFSCHKPISVYAGWVVAYVPDPEDGDEDPMVEQPLPGEAPRPDTRPRYLH